MLTISASFTLNLSKLGFLKDFVCILQGKYDTLVIYFSLTF